MVKMTIHFVNGSVEHITITDNEYYARYDNPDNIFIPERWKFWDDTYTTNLAYNPANIVGVEFSFMEE